MDTTMTESNRMSVDEHVARILEIDSQIRVNTLKKAEYILAASEEYPDIQETIAKKLGMSQGTFAKWIAIGENKIISDFRDNLPSAFSALYHIVVLHNKYEKHHGTGHGYKKTAKNIEDKKISRASGNNDIGILVKRLERLIQKKADKQIQQKINNLRDKIEIENPVKLDDFIKSAKCFHTIVVVPTNEQISEWGKLDFPTDIGDAFPMHDLRHTHHSTTMCFLKISRHKLPIGIQCFDGWGFRYADYKQSGEDVVLVGYRGELKKLNLSGKLDTIDDICKFAQTVSKKEYIIIGAETTLKGWTVSHE
jgi:hypothetical protein